MSGTSPEKLPPHAPAPRRSLGRRIAKGAGIGVASIGGLVVLVVGVVLVGANIGPGRHFIEREVSSLTGNTVVASGLSGRFPDALKLAKIELRDKKGAWLTIENLKLDWSPLRMIGRTVQVDLLQFDRLAIPRLPESDGAKSSSNGPTKTGLGINIKSVDAKWIEIGAPVAGLPAVFALQGHAVAPQLDPLINGVSFRTLPKADIAVDLKRLDAQGTIKVAAQTDAHDLALDLTAQEGADGIVASMSNMPELAPLTLTFHMAGPTHAAAPDFHAGHG